MPAQAGIQYAATSRKYVGVAEYWIIRWSLSSGGHSADPLADDDAENAACKKITIHHGIANRSVLPPLLMSTAAKPVAAKPRVPQSPCSLVSNLLSRVQS